jgi:hypothetical protein
MAARNRRVAMNRSERWSKIPANDRGGEWRRKVVGAAADRRCGLYILGLRTAHPADGTGASPAQLRSAGRRGAGNEALYREAMLPEGQPPAA